MGNNRVQASPSIGASQSLPPTSLAEESPLQTAIKITARRMTSGGSTAPLKRKESDVTKPLDSVNLYSSLVAGAGSGATASILCAPLDLVRTRLQVWGEVTGKQGAMSLIPQMMRETIQRDGYRGCFRGLGATLVTVPLFWGVYFPLYDDFKRRMAIQYPDTYPGWIHLASAVSAGAISDLVCNPLFVVRTRVQTEALHGTDTHQGMRQTAKSLLAEAGGDPRVFWKGMTANLIGLSHGGVQFPVYEFLKKRFRGDEKEHPSAFDILLASGMSKMAACLLTYPHEVIRSRMMDSREKVRFVDTCRSLYAKEGWAGFYAGLPISLVRVIPNTCITFTTYEFLCRWSREKLRANGN